MKVATKSHALRAKTPHREPIGRCRNCGGTGRITATKRVHDECVQRYMKCTTIGCDGEWRTSEAVDGDIEKSKLVARRPRKLLPAPTATEL